MDIRIFVPALVFAAGVYFLIRFKFFIKPHSGIKRRHSFSLRGGFASLMLALSGTLGVGNIFGVATAIIIGGAGSVLWLLFSAIFAAVIKYAEVSLTVSHTSGDGMISVIRKSFPLGGRVLSYIYAALTLALAVVMGFALQGGSVCSTAELAFGIPPVISSLLLAAIVGYIASGKGKKIKAFTSFILPLTTIIYIIMTLYIIFVNFSRVGDVLKLIATDAFSVDSTVGGLAGFLLSKKVREGFCGGILSNEAGAGTSSLAHTSGGNIGAVGGAVEVLFDTVVLCMLTAFAILLSVPELYAYTSGAELILAAVYSTLGGAGIGALLFTALSFAVCTIVCWYYYGSVCYRTIFGKEPGRGFIALAAFSVVFGAGVSTDALAVASHYLLLFLSVISLLTLIKNSGRIVSTTLPKSENIKASESSRVSRRQVRKAPYKEKQPRLR